MTPRHQPTEDATPEQTAHLADLEARTDALEDAGELDPVEQTPGDDRLENLEARVGSLNVIDAAQTIAEDTPEGRGEVNEAGLPLPVDDALEVTAAGIPVPDPQPVAVEAAHEVLADQEPPTA